MRKFKIIDTIINILLIVGCSLWILISEYDAFKKLIAKRFSIWVIVNEDDFFKKITISYFVIGGWQVISMIVHAIKKSFCEAWSKRYIYHVITLVLIIIMLLGLLIYPLLFIYLILMYIAPFLAIYYTYLCYQETFIKPKRPMDLLK